MEAICVEEQKQKKIVKVTIFIQCAFILSYLAILILKPAHYLFIAEKFGWFALLASFGLARLYIYQGKKIENLKNFSDEEFESIKKQYFFYYFSLYPFWVIAIVATKYFS
jgi:uncharacterized membrane protein YbhN (UPF0104 family)